MAKQHRIEVTYLDESTEELIIHSDDTLEWVTGPKSGETIKKLTTARQIETGIIDWMKLSEVSKIEVTKEEEE